MANSLMTEANLPNFWHKNHSKNSLECKHALYYFRPNEFIIFTSASRTSEVSIGKRPPSENTIKRPYSVKLWLFCPN